MGCRTLIGTATSGGTYTTRWLHHGEHPDRLVPLLRTLRAHAAAGITAALVAVLTDHDWSHLDPHARRTRSGLRVVPGVGYATTTSIGPLTGRLGGEVDSDLEWLYLLDPATDTVVVYEATRHDRWLRHSLHTLTTTDDGELFATWPVLWCLTCGVLDGVEYRELPSMAGSGADTHTRRGRCGAAETTDPIFGRHAHPVTWPPHLTRRFR